MLPVLRVGNRKICAKFIIINDQKLVAITPGEWQEILEFVGGKKEAELKKNEKQFLQLALYEMERTEREEQMVNLTDFMKRIAVEDIKAVRRKKKISRKKLAQISGLTVLQVTDLETNPTGVSTETFNKVAKALNIKIEI